MGDQPARPGQAPRVGQRPEGLRRIALGGVLKRRAGESGRAIYGMAPILHAAAYQIAGASLLTARYFVDLSVERAWLPPRATEEDWEVARTRAEIADFVVTAPDFLGGIRSTSED